jgi:hypothetical protein
MGFYYINESLYKETLFEFEFYAVKIQIVNQSINH